MGNSGHRIRTCGGGIAGCPKAASGVGSMPGHRLPSARALGAPKPPHDLGLPRRDAVTSAANLVARRRSPRPAVRPGSRRKSRCLRTAPPVNAGGRNRTSPPLRRIIWAQPDRTGPNLAFVRQAAVVPRSGAVDPSTPSLDPRKRSVQGMLSGPVTSPPGALAPTALKGPPQGGFEANCAGGTRTPDLWNMNPASYQLLHHAASQYHRIRR